MPHCGGAVMPDSSCRTNGACWYRCGLIKQSARVNGGFQWTPTNLSGLDKVPLTTIVALMIFMVHSLPALVSCVPLEMEAWLQCKQLLLESNPASAVANCFSRPVLDLCGRCGCQIHFSLLQQWSISNLVWFFA